MKEKDDAASESEFDDAASESESDEGLAEPFEIEMIEIHNMNPKQCNCVVEGVCDVCMLGRNAVCELCDYTLEPCDKSNTCGKCEDDRLVSVIPIFLSIVPEFPYNKHCVNTCIACREDPMLLAQRCVALCEKRESGLPMTITTRDDWMVLYKRREECVQRHSASLGEYRARMFANEEYDHTLAFPEFDATQ